MLIELVLISERNSYHKNIFTLTILHMFDICVQYFLYVALTIQFTFINIFVLIKI